jgi:cytochrome c-type biogenesis protein CcmE
MNEKIMVVGLLAVVGLLYLFVGSATEGGQWFMEVDEAVASASVTPDRPIRVKGNVVPGTYLTAQGSTEHRFSIAGAQGEAAMPVYYNGPMPDVFAEGREVVVEGFRRADGTLEATEVIAKCPSKYEGGLSAEAREQLGEPGKAVIGAPGAASGAAPGAAAGAAPGAQPGSVVPTGAPAGPPSGY